MSLIALVLALSITNDVPPAPRPMLPIPLLETGLMSETGYVAHLTIAADGRWTATGDQKGELAKEELAQIAAYADQVVLTSTPGPRCKSTPVIRVLRVQRGEARYADECGPQAHASVRLLVAQAEAFTLKRVNPMAVRLDRWEPGKSELRQSIILLRSGIWTTDNGAGNTGGQELADAIAAFDSAVLDAPTVPETPDCSVDHIQQLEVPGRGTLRWSSPCQAPSPTLAAAIAKLFTIVGLPR